MEMNLQPQVVNEVVFEGEDGAYYSWSPSKLPVLDESKVGGGKLVLQPRGFALPHYADSTKIGFVVQGCCTVGMLFPNSSEKVLLIKKGDVIPVPLGAVSWWFNGGDSEMVMVFLGDTTTAYIPGQFTYFLLTGALGILNGFSTQLISKSYNLTENQSNTLVKNQSGVLIVKLGDEITTMPKPNIDENDQKLFLGIDDVLADKITVKDAGAISCFTSANFPLLEQVGLSATFVKLESNAIYAPKFASDSSVEVVYVVGGGGRVEIVGVNGQSALNAEVKEGELFVVPKFFISALVADGKGMDLFSVMTSSKPVIERLAGNTSVWKNMSPVVLQASLDIAQEFEQLFKLNIENSNLLIPGSN
ncbi:hypothetical protein DCAR_0103544 [Daucus carota subsp. sativus]|uniref:Uncharacterized protein n=1 Tax=Daucus carota subsp. sativus TaxID=79200 RepID=A0A166I2S9_DAUCS|nr:PREDICTED: 11S globulin seed storage protein 2-like [Daucus carota subsp. sativus]WOG84361.1 hypothetical protein DCAR_0103544 [Daucus carota subsp. sativus]